MAVKPGIDIADVGQTKDDSRDLVVRLSRNGAWAGIWSGRGCMGESPWLPVVLD